VATPANGTKPQGSATGARGQQPLVGEEVKFTSEIGTGLLVVFVLAALAMAWVYKRMDDVTERWGADCDLGSGSNPTGSR
jgi:hypothetical protein